MIDGQEEGQADDVLELHEEVAEGQQQDEDGEEEVVLSLGEDAPREEDDTPLVKRLRQQLREAHRGNRAPAVQTDDPEPVVPPRKRIEEFDFDADRFDAYDEDREKAVRAHAAWLARADDRKRQAERAQQEEAKRYEQQIASLGVSNAPALIAKAREALSETQVAALAQAVDNPAKILAALGQNPAALDELAAIPDTQLARFVAKIGKLEDKIVVTKRRKNAPPPETKVRGATASNDMGQRELDRLEREAEKTGDRTKVVAYKRQMRQAAA